MPPTHRLSLSRQKAAYIALRNTLEGYYPLSDATWSAYRSICTWRQISKGAVLYPAGEVPHAFAYVYQGLFRVYVLDDKGAEYNKNFFAEGRFPGSMTALLRREPSRFTIEALEDAAIIEIDHAGYRRLLEMHDDLKNFHIHYLERHWLMDKEPREVALVQDEASVRYRRFLEDFPRLAQRLPQYHIASHLGITPTQLSRIRKNLPIDQPM
ncbi:Crp/Fnr family transcriptional regulator [Microbulbifer celer]|uniref:Crp/Fnr family transcriptional regulator n=1 Tax=Microbulbifer celer TaxID=435905 RepID=A0ABW3U8W5_9GAMM|nr:Crp/Fnr family transcriptional regulator [Microbulbifer celer]UFN56666.1 Crp/Fnr family transcriptional regulator [Microbulbifer celer]